MLGVLESLIPCTECLCNAWRGTRHDSIYKEFGQISLSLSLPLVSRGRKLFERKSATTSNFIHRKDREDRYLLWLDNSGGSNERGHRDIPFRWEFCAERFHPPSCVFPRRSSGERRVRSGENGVKPTGFWCHSERMEGGKTMKSFSSISRDG